MMERTNGVATYLYGVFIVSTNPTWWPPNCVTHNYSRRPFSAAANDEITRNVSAE